MSGLAAIVLAAGKGTRMKSGLPKVLHSVAGKSMLLHVLDMLRAVDVARAVVVIPPDGAAIREAVGDRAETVVQAEQLGTAHAVLQASEMLSDADQILVLCGDTPLVISDTVEALLRRHAESAAAVTLLTAIPPDCTGLGRIVRDAEGHVVSIVEEKEATPEQRCIREINTGVYCYDGRVLWRLLPGIPLGPSGEAYLTDVIAAIRAEGGRVADVVASDPAEAIGINNRIQLSVAEGVLRQRVRERLMLEGITLVDPPSTFIDADVQIGRDTVVHPGTTISGVTRIGERCVIGPGSVIADSVLGNDCRVLMSVVESSTLDDKVSMGPFCHVRAEAHLAREVHLGNFAEIKKSEVGTGTRMHHFSYLGDAKLGERVNVGAGTITCNYDGVHKWTTTIDDDVFIGSDTLLIAPVEVGRGAKTGAGSVVTRNVPPGSTVFGVPARIKNEESR
ncbi:MAG: UDP-N-acetylglucosamine diphosphorylase/glucosamine-1-phosphate N-acetyltransferase [Chloroflexota bacterium]|nr:MAG: UDP-N-acetylglucosamine diphosphorylase/glucosamine-1-phosphate N-acetyltransferase [Chloroflexota bacterium]